VKTIAIKPAGSEADPIDTVIYPGTTAGEILGQHDLQGYLLSTGPNANRFFGFDENIYPSVVDGDKLWASAKAEVGVIAR
jgi:hypothetical protein